MEAQISKTGAMVDSMPTARPLIITVAGPVLAFSAISRTGFAEV